MNFDIVLFQFVYALVPFFIQLSVAEGLFVYGLKRRPLFWARLAAGVVISAGAVLLLSVVISLVSHFLLGALIYVVIFALTVCVLLVCYDESFGTLLFCGLAAYAAQNMGYRLYCIAELCGLTYMLGMRIGFGAASALLGNICMAIVYVVVYFLFARRMKKYKLARLHNRNVLLISASTLTITVVLCAWTNNYYWQHFPLLIINFLFSVLACVFTLCLQSGMLENVALRQDMEIVEKLWHDDIARYELSKENIEMINMKCHDLKHRLREMRLSDCDVSKEEIEEIENAVNIYDCNIKTGCEPLDVILTEKSLFCRKNGIKLSCMADGESLDFMTAGELYTLFGNMLSNAVEAVQKISDKDKRVIDFTARRVGEMLVICTENYCDVEPTFKNGLPKTSKADEINHGYGIKSMKLLVEKHGGELKASADGGTFTLRILLPVPHAQTEIKLAS